MNMNELKNIGEKNNQTRNKKTAWIYFLSAITAFPTIILFHFTDKGTITSVVPLLISLVLMMIFITYLNWAWFTNMDAFEKMAIGKTTFWGLSSIVIIVPWMLLNELGIVSKPDPFFIVLFAYAISLFLYYYEKFSSH